MMEHEGDNYTNCDWCFCYSHQRIIKETWMQEGEWRPFKQQHLWDRLEYWAESWRIVKTCFHLNFSERPSAKTDVKNSQGVNNNTNNNV